MRAGAGDGRGGYMPLFKSWSNDGGKTWSAPQAMPGIGCARPHLLQVGKATILVAGRAMMGPHYSRSFSVWMSQDGGDTWEWASGSYHHNEKARITGAPLWPAAVNK